MELESIKLKTTWNDAAESINSNNLKIITEVTKLQSATYKNKGYFGSIYALQEAYPTSSPGSKAYVGRTYPYTIYIWENNSWINSGETGGEESVDLSDYYTKEEFEQKVTDFIPEIIDDTWWIDGKNTGLPARGEKGDVVDASYMVFDVDENMELNLTFLSTNNQLELDFNIDGNGYLTVDK